MLYKFRTTENLIKAFLYKCEFSSVLSIYKNLASRSGFEVVAKALVKIKEYEQTHAELFYSNLYTLMLREEENVDFNDLETDIKLILSYDDTSTNLHNLKEHDLELLDFFRVAASDAEAEGFDEISKLFINIATVEDRLISMIDELQTQVSDNTLFVSDDTAEWICSKCGYLHTSVQAPEICPLCKQAKANFYLASELRLR